MSNAKKLAYALIDALNACGIEEEFSYRFIAEMNDILRKENEKLEMNNEARAVAGNNDELTKNIIMLMKEYGLTSVEALELIDKLSKPKVKVEANLTNNVGDIANVMQDVYTSGEDPGDTHEPSKGSGTIDYDGLISAVAGHLDVNDWFTFNQIIKEHQEQNDHKEVKGND